MASSRKVPREHELHKLTDQTDENDLANNEDARAMMTLLDSLRSRHVHTRSRQSRRDGRRPGRKAVLEFQPGWDQIALEPRMLLSAVNWINPAGGDWDTGSNWSTGSVPGASDDVTLDLSPGITVTHSQDDADSVNTLTLARDQG